MSDPKKEQQKMVLRELNVRSTTFDRDARTVDVVMSTGARRRIGVYDPIEEEIPLDAANLTRINTVGPVLDNHRSYGSVLDTLGAVVRDSVRVEGEELVGQIKFARTERADAVMQMIADDILRAVSVGYTAEYERIRAKDRADGGDVDLYRAVTWEPHEVSIVQMPADIDAVIRAAVAQDETVSAIAERNVERKAMPAQNQPVPAADGAVTANNHTPEPSAIARAAQVIATTRSLLERSGVEGVSAEELVAQHAGDDQKIRSAVLDLVVQRSEKTRVNGAVRVEMGATEETKRRSALVDGLLHRMDPNSVKLDDASGRFRRMRMIDIAKSVLEGRGVSTRNMGDEEVARLATRSTGDGFHSVSDFPGILSDLANKRLRNAYKAQEPVWKRFGRRVDFNDFRAINVYKISDFPDLEEVSEGGEYTNGTLNESSETYRGTKAGRIVALTWEAILADDLRAFDQGLRSAGQAALRRENRAFYKQLTGSTEMGDGVQLFDASRGNISAVGGAGSISVVSAAITAMATMTGDGPDSKDPLDIMPAFLLCPQKQRVAYHQALGYDPRRAPDAPANQVPPEFEGITVLPTGWLDPIDDIVSYLVANPAMIDTLEYGYLRGEEGPQVFQDDSFRVDGTAYKIRHTFALKFIEPRAFVKIPAS